MQFPELSCNVIKCFYAVHIGNSCLTRHHKTKTETHWEVLILRNNNRNENIHQ